MRIGENEASQWVLKWLKAPFEYLLRSDIAEREAAARLIGHGTGHRQGHATGHEVGYAKGFDDGVVEGTALGDLAGYSRGFADGETRYRIIDERTPFQSKPLEESLYGPKRFAITEEMKRLMASEVAAAKKEKIVGIPTDEQWSMIFSDHPATCVSAGAGSGKSTTLVLRVVFMVQHMGVPLDSITVISFTRASCAELRRKLAKVLGHWQGRDIEEDDLEQTVRTFHSLLMRVVRPGFPKLIVFERPKKNKILRSEDEDDLADNPAAASKLNEEQLQLLHEAYQTAYNDDHAFRAHVHELFKREFDLRQFVSPQLADDYKARSYAYASNRDLLIVREMRTIWSPLGLDESPIELGPILAFRHLGNPFYADGRLGTDGPFVILDLPEGEWKQTIATPGTNDIASIYKVLAMRHRIFSAHCEAPMLRVRSPQDLENLSVLLRIQQGADGPKALEPPKFEVRLPGEMKPVRLVEALYAQGEFISSLGRDIQRLLTDIGSIPAHLSYEHHFIGALGPFWIAFEQILADRGIVPFNRLFSVTTKNAKTQAVNQGTHERMRHLLVDEFQDISPLIADWLTAMQEKLLLKAPGKSVSIMAIGDDWQSIYGWRGSSPELFIGFPKYFRTHSKLGPSPKVELTTNFRSIPEIVEDAAALIAKVGHKQDKECKSSTTANDWDHGLRVMEFSDIGTLADSSKPENIAAHLKDFILGQYYEAAAAPTRSEDLVLVMSRGNEILKALKKVLPKLEGLSLKTYHGAKGLEADIAVMVDDCRPGDVHPFRNLVYDASGRFPDDFTYEQAKEDEAYRLGYVGITRGKRRVYWFVRDLATGFAARAASEQI